MGFTDAYEIRDRQTYTGQQVLNVYHCEKLNPAFDSNDVALAYRGTVMDAILAVQPSQLTHDVIEVQSLSEPTDFATLTFTPNVGLLTGQSGSAFTAATIQFNRLRTDMKNGQKRWVAGSETEMSGNDWITSFLVDLDVLAQAVIANWIDPAVPGVPVATFAIIKRICTTSPSPPCVGGYRLPKDTDPYIAYFPTSYIVRDTIRSQVSRKRLI